MKELVISSSAKNEYVIKGATDELLRNKRARLMLRNQLNYEVKNDALVICSEETIAHVAKILKLVAKYIGAEVQYDSKVNADIEDFKNKEEMFGIFSTQALNIKNNECNSSDFKDFADTLHENMPCRHLYALQMLSAYHLAFSQNACNFSVPGAGKTSIVYGAYTYLKSRPSDNIKHVDKLLIVGPLSSFAPWEKEYEECFGRKAVAQRIGSGMSLEEKKSYFYRDDTAELNLISYQTLANVNNELLFFLRNHKVMVVLDEAHKIKSTRGGVQASAIMGMAKYCTSRVVLTGSPAPNGYEDIYNLFHFIWPQNDVIKYNIAQLRDMSRTPNDERIGKMMANVSPYFIRICKHDLHLPPAIDNKPIIVPMKDSQRRIYDYIEDRFVEEVKKEKHEASLHNVLMKAKMIRLQQVATNPALLKEPISSFSQQYDMDLSSAEAEDSIIMRDIMRFYNENVPAKYEECCRLVKEILGRGEKAIIWAIFIENIKRLEVYLKSQGVECRTLYGATPVASDDMSEEQYALTREAIVNEFHRIDSPFKIIIANPFAVAESISLHKACHNAIYLERSFNCAHFIQSKDRIHRYGLSQDVKTNYYYILSEDSVDETIDCRLREKEKRMLDIIENQPIPLFDNVLDEDGDDSDIKAILTDYIKRKARNAV